MDLDPDALRRAVEVEDLVLPAGSFGSVAVRLARPRVRLDPLPVVAVVNEQSWSQDGWDEESVSSRADFARPVSALLGAAVLLPGFELSGSDPADTLHAVLRWVTLRGRVRGLRAEEIALLGVGSGAQVCLEVAERRRRERVAPLVAVVLSPRLDGDPGALPKLAQSLKDQGFSGWSAM